MQADLDEGRLVALPVVTAGTGEPIGLSLRSADPPGPAALRVIDTIRALAAERGAKAARG